MMHILFSNEHDETLIIGWTGQAFQSEAILMLCIYMFSPFQHEAILRNFFVHIYYAFHFSTELSPGQQLLSVQFV